LGATVGRSHIHAHFLDQGPIEVVKKKKSIWDQEGGGGGRDYNATRERSHIS